MNHRLVTKQCPIHEMSFDRQMGRYLLSIKVGTYYEFNSFAHSNQRHYHDCFELVIVLDGHGTFEHEGVKYHLKAGDLFIAKPGAEHEIHIKPSEAMNIFYLFFKISASATPSYTSFEEEIISHFLDGHYPFLLNNRKMLAYITFINEYTHYHKQARDPWLMNLITQFILQNLQGLSQYPATKTIQSIPTTIQTFEWVLDYIDQTIETALSATSLAATIGVSRSTLYTMFKKELNCSVHTYIKQRKMDLAKHYLSTGLSVTEVAGLVGIESPSYFGRLFKQYVGMTPSDYASDHRDRSLGIGRRQTF